MQDKLEDGCWNCPLHLHCQWYIKLRDLVKLMRFETCTANVFQCTYGCDSWLPCESPEILDTSQAIGYYEGVGSILIAVRPQNIVFSYPSTIVNMTR